MTICPGCCSQCTPNTTCTPGRGQHRPWAKAPHFVLLVLVFHILPFFINITPRVSLVATVYLQRRSTEQSPNRSPLTFKPTTSNPTSTQHFPLGRFLHSRQHLSLDKRKRTFASVTLPHEPEWITIRCRFALQHDVIRSRPFGLAVTTFTANQARAPLTLLPSCLRELFSRSRTSPSIRTGLPSILLARLI